MQHQHHRHGETAKIGGRRQPAHFPYRLHHFHCRYHLGHLHHVNILQPRLNPLAQHGFIGKAGQVHPPIGQAGDHRVRRAEFAMQAILWNRMNQGPRAAVGHADPHAPHLVQRAARLALEPQRGLNDFVHHVAARVALLLKARVRQRKRLSQAQRRGPMIRRSA